MSYAQKTKVPVVQTVNEIQKELKRFGATEFGYILRESVKDGQQAQVAFRVGRYAVRMSILVPEDEQLARSRWRSLLLGIKAKLVMVDEGISTVEREFLADVVAPNGRTVFENVEPALLSGKTPQLLLSGPSE